MFLVIAATILAQQDEIIVTAERRTSDRQSAPVSISVIDRGALSRIAIDHPAEALNRAAGAYIHRGSGQEHLTAIRSPVLTGGAGAGSFLILEDGVPSRAPAFANVNGLFETSIEFADRIEIARGPSSAFYGANAIHGVVHILTPSPGEPLTEIAASVDTIGRIKSTGVIAREDFVGAYHVLDDPGWRRDSGVDLQKALLGWRAAVGTTAITVKAAAYNLEQETAGFVIGPDAYRDLALARGNADPDAYRDAAGARIMAQIDAPLTERMSLSVVPYARWNEMEFRLHFFPSRAIEENAHWSVGAQTAIYYDDDEIDAAIGFDTDYSDGDLVETQFLPTVFSYTQGLHYDYRVEALSLSPFARIGADFGPWRAEIAARLDHTRMDYDNRTASGIVGRFVRRGDRIDRFTTVSPKASLSRRIGEATAYLSYARGARPPQATDLYRLQINQTDDAARAETIDAFEAGFKWRRGDALGIDAAGYFMRKRNFFFRDADGYNVNDGRTRHVGAEAEVFAQLAPSLRISGAAAYGRHSYRFSRPVLSAPQASEAISFGDVVDTAPRWTSNLVALWSPHERTAIEAEWAHVGRYFTDAANQHDYEGHDIVNLRASYQISARWRLSAALRNALDARYAERADFAFGEERYFPGEGRIASLSLTFDLEGK
jgi:outer membrane receptor protein involved in Fe transport